MVTKHKIEDIKVNKTVKGVSAKTGKPYEITNVGLKLKGQWYNAGLGADQITSFNLLKIGESVMLETFQEEYKGKMYNKFRFPKKIDVLEVKIDWCIDQIQILKSRIDESNI